MKTKGQQGFAVVEAILILVAVCLIGFTGWFVWQSRQNAENSLRNTGKSGYPTYANKQDENKSETLKTAVGPGTYTDDFNQFSIDYPKGWVLSVGDSDPTLHITSATITDPSGKYELNLDTSSGGKGGDCQPKKGDVPFAKGNECPTFEYLSSEKLPVNNVYRYVDDTKGGSSLIKSTLVIATYHYAWVDGVSKYGIAVTNDDAREPIINLNDPRMGFYLSYPPLSVYNSSGKNFPAVYIHSINESEDFLSSDEAKIIKSIIRTLKFNI